MTSSLYFLPPTSSPPWALISSKISSVAPLWGMPQGAAGPESGVAMPNLMMSAAPALPVLTAIRTAAMRSVDHESERHGFIAIPPGCWVWVRGFLGYADYSTRATGNSGRAFRGRPGPFPESHRSTGPDHRAKLVSSPSSASGQGPIALDGLGIRGVGAHVDTL